MKILIIFIFIQISSSKAVEFQCKFTGSYRCEVISGIIESKDDVYVTGVSGLHAYSKTNNDVLGFDARGTSLSYFPRNLNLFLPSVTEIFIEGRLREIAKQDLVQYPELLWLYLCCNEIEVLEKDLFVHNRNLKLIFLGNNRIKYVHLDVFDHLWNLSFLAFDSNKCHSGHVENNRNGALILIKNIKDKCSNSPEKHSVAVAAPQWQLITKNPQNRREITATVPLRCFNTSFFIMRRLCFSGVQPGEN